MGLLPHLYEEDKANLTHLSNGAWRTEDNVRTWKKAVHTGRLALAYLTSGHLFS